MRAQLVADYGSDDEVTLLRDAFNWYIDPVLNPDGYNYTWTTVSSGLDDNVMWCK